MAVSKTYSVTYRYGLPLVLEGQTVNLPATKIPLCTKYCVKKDVPLFCTERDYLVHIFRGVVASICARQK